MKALLTPILITLCIGITSCSNTEKQLVTKDEVDVVELPDGSIAYLNTHSSITYDTLFEERRVKQLGEVFFEVETNSTPFIVETEFGEITVLGTEFNVVSDEEGFEVEVEEGSVSLQVGNLNNTLKEGDKARFKKDLKEIKIGKADFNYKKWRNALRRDFRKFGNAFKKESKKLDKHSKKWKKELNKELKELKKD